MEFKLETPVITLISVLISAIGALSLYIKSLHKHHTNAQKENLQMMSNVVMENTKQSVTQSTLIQSQIDLSKEMKTLLHTINIQQIKDSKNGE